MGGWRGGVRGEPCCVTESGMVLPAAVHLVRRGDRKLQEEKASNPEVRFSVKNSSKVAPFGRLGFFFPHFHDSSVFSILLISHIGERC